MSAGAIIGIVVAVLVVLVVLGMLLRPFMERRRLQQRFGPEYERTVSAADNRRDGERELADRQRRHAELALRPLSAASRDHYSREWLHIQERFVDAPTEAVAAADELVTAFMAERGYPTESYDQQVVLLSVEHAGSLQHYRTGHDIAARGGESDTSTEDLRRAMVHYRAFLDDLLNKTDSPHAKVGSAKPTQRERG
ncbi:hypothetical protein F0L68_29460 [Solihabitans fulvus]|uniref:Secreted protein n=1 Tax=Solihabitans fulvus TaxID=1892852 RepID=A0A5B2WWU6_9PSEU|nr:hypothetical protein [Solihabitans fulvus]KAA2254909.1 hypothetical protein F0L68_29460 [Solihabitans fulvus]